jgi:hypothetical protein
MSELPAAVDTQQLSVVWTRHGNFLWISASWFAPSSGALGEEPPDALLAAAAPPVADVDEVEEPPKQMGAGSWQTALSRRAHCVLLHMPAGAGLTTATVRMPCITSCGTAMPTLATRMVECSPLDELPPAAEPLPPVAAVVLEAESAGRTHSSSHTCPHMTTHSITHRWQLPWQCSRDNTATPPAAGVQEGHVALL